MIFNQKDDGSCDLEFSQEEIKSLFEVEIFPSNFNHTFQRNHFFIFREA